MRCQRQGEDAGLLFKAHSRTVETGRPDVAEHLGTGKRTFGGRDATAGLAVDQLLEHQIVAFLEDAGIDQVESGVGFAFVALNALGIVGPGL
ncbi:hypothetical protein D3C87_1765200 [compost metagenome]